MVVVDLSLYMLHSISSWRMRKARAPAADDRSGVLL